MSTVRIQVRRGVASDWTSVNPVLAAGEMGYESDTNKFKFGNGTGAWNTLSYAASDTPGIGEIAQDAINSALVTGTGLTKTYNDGANTITVAIDDAVWATKSYVDGIADGINNTADSTYIAQSDRGAVNGVASLDSNGLVPNSQIDADNWATKLDVSAAVSGIQIKDSVNATSTANLAVTRSAGSADAEGGNGVGETLTATANGALVIDGVTLAVGNRVLLKDQTDKKQNGIYTVTNTGSSSSHFVLTRAEDADNSTGHEVSGGLFVFTLDGTSNARDGYTLLKGGSRPGDVFRLGTDNLEFTQFTGAIATTVGTGLKKVNDVIEIDYDLIATTSTVTTLDNNLSSDISGLTTRMTTAEQDINAVETTANTAAADITTINTHLGTLDTTTASHTSTLASQASSITAIQGVNSTQTTNINTINSSITTINEQITDINAAAATLNTNLRADLAPKASPTFTGVVTLPNGTVTSAMILDGTIATGDIADGAVATAKIADSAVATAKIADSAVTTAKIADSAITSAKIADGTIVDADINASAAIAQTKISGLTSDLAAKAPLASPTLTGTPEAPTAAAGTNTTQIATTAFVKTAVNNVIAAAPGALDTLNELASALGNDASFSTTITNALAAKAPLANPTFTGTVTVAASGVAFTDGTQTKQGVPSITTISSKTADYTLSALTERDSMIELNSSSAITVTVPANSSVAYPVGTSIDLLRVGSGAVTIAAGAGVTINATPGLKLRAQWSSATLLKRSTDTWVLLGDLTA